MIKCGMNIGYEKYIDSILLLLSFRVSLYGGSSLLKRSGMLYYSPDLTAFYFHTCVIFIETTPDLDTLYCLIGLMEEINLTFL